jgi:hypothetical protein
MNHLVSITKSDGTNQLFEEEKLVNSLKRVGAPIQAIDEIVNDVEKEMHEGISTADIYRRAFGLLKRHSHHVAAKYSIRRAMLELGPDGFPFEKFVARIFQIWGYETAVDQTLLGSCVEHEVDIVAWNNDELAMIEAKYHNEFALKSDLKVALYVKARFDDLADKSFNFGGKERKLTERYLFTNTKFTDKAIAYGNCVNLKLVGWNFPESGNMHDIVEQNGLHPITCITSLSKDQKKSLIAMNILACIDIIGQPNCLDKINIRNEDKEKVLTEVQMIIEQAK